MYSDGNTKKDEYNDWKYMRARGIFETPEKWAKVTTRTKNPELLKSEVWAHPINEPEVGALALCLVHPDQLSDDRLFFYEAVVLITYHGEDGTAGVIINKPSNVRLEEASGHLMERAEYKPFADNEIYLGGVQGLAGNLEIMHRYPELEGAAEIEGGSGICIGGNLEEAALLVQEGQVRPSCFRFIQQYIRWGPGVLKRAAEEGHWCLASSSPQLLLRDYYGMDRAWRQYNYSILRDPLSNEVVCEPLWREVMRLLGGKYQKMGKEWYGM
eukprot:CAMPEP_0113937124 /NCGR_PEP_ID=MMETSP1339-20121228/3820_1 /TAXON_ID=94617 /ORGANISM="Fibrocapsa japonica" /LENGTH=269 /DNA_ID=CAMNT_0000939783 /DNA_START=176 /DNA_END=985 /DNA_ORIENTATION=+ /assembly_acc=CAM_ASM_000762